MPFAHAGGQDDRSARLDDRQRRHHALDRLVERRVQRIAGRAGHDDVDRAGERGRDRRAGKRDAFQKGGFHVAGHDAERRAAGLSITALTMKSQPAMRAMAVFSSWTGLPSRQPLRALGCSRNRGPCQTWTVSKAAMPGQISLRPPEKPAMKCGSISPVVIFSSACDVTRVDPDGHAARALAQVRVLVASLAVMVLDAVVGGDVRADHLDQFVAHVGAVQAGGHEDENLAAGNAGRFERLEDRRQQDRVRHRPGNVADGHAGMRRPRARSPSGGEPMGCSRLCRTAASGSAKGSKGR